MFEITHTVTMTTQVRDNISDRVRPDPSTLCFQKHLRRIANNGEFILFDIKRPCCQFHKPNSWKSPTTNITFISRSLLSIIINDASLWYCDLAIYQNSCSYSMWQVNYFIKMLSSTSDCIIFLYLGVTDIFLNKIDHISISINAQFKLNLVLAFASFINLSI